LDIIIQTSANKDRWRDMIANVRTGHRTTPNDDDLLDWSSSNLHDW